MFTSDLYSIQTGVSLVSLFENNKNINFCVLITHSKLNDENINKINCIGKQYRQKIILRQVSCKESLSEQDLLQHSTLFTINSLPNDWDHVLLFESDMIVQGDISVYCDLRGYDFVGPCVLFPHHKIVKEYYNIAPSTDIFTAVSTWINLVTWREGNFQSRYENLFRNLMSSGKDPYYSCEGLITKLFEGYKTKRLHRKYHLIPQDAAERMDVPYINRHMCKGVSFYTSEEMSECINHPVIIHYPKQSSFLRPWFDSCTCNYQKYYLKYKALSPWRNVPLQSQKESLFRRAYRVFLTLMRDAPKPIAMLLYILLAAPKRAISIWYHYHKHNTQTL